MKNRTIPYLPAVSVGEGGPLATQRRSLTSLLLLLCLLLFSHTARALDIGVSWAVFATPDQPYVEVNLEIAAQTILFKRIDSLQMQASAEITIMLKQGDKVVSFEKYVLNSPLTATPQTLLDVKRFVVPNGDYTLEVICADVNNPANKDSYTVPVEVSVGKEKIHLAQLQLLRGFKADNSESSFSKNGYFLEPLPFSFYDKNAVRLAFYTEVYHSIKNVSAEGYLVRYFIEREKGNGIREVITMGNQKKKPTPIDAVLAQMDISKLESGNYTLTVEIRNSANDLLTSRQVSFQRSNPFLEVKPSDLTEELVAKQFVQDLDEPTLRFALQAIGVLAAGSESEELKGILKQGDLKKMRFYLFRHFVTRDPNNPDIAYQKYMETARAADAKFKSGFRYGFESDRGRTFMRFGRPDDLIHVEDDPGAPPYEIWVYYKFPTTQQNNVKFLFYNPSLAGEDFMLLHSNARGEISNPRWEVTLYQRNAQGQENDNYGDATSMKRNYNRNARVYFEDF